MALELALAGGPARFKQGFSSVLLDKTYIRSASFFCLYTATPFWPVIQTILLTTPISYPQLLIASYRKSDYLNDQISTFNMYVISQPLIFVYQLFAQINRQNLKVWLLRFRSPLLSQSLFTFLYPILRCFSSMVPGSLPMCSASGNMT